MFFISKIVIDKLVAILARSKKYLEITIKLEILLSIPIIKV